MSWSLLEWCGKVYERKVYLSAVWSRTRKVYACCAIKDGFFFLVFIFDTLGLESSRSGGMWWCTGKNVSKSPTLNSKLKFRHTVKNNRDTTQFSAISRQFCFSPRLRVILELDDPSTWKKWTASSERSTLNLYRLILIFEERFEVSC